MKPEITAQHINRPNATGTVQNFIAQNGVRVDQDGNRYESKAVKLSFLKNCLAQGIRSGNLKPITTDNQRADLITRINATARELGEHEI